MKNKAIFFDRDGVLNKNLHYISTFDNFYWLKNAKKAIKLAYNNKFILIVITNQSGVARGFFTVDAVKKIHKLINRDLKKTGCKIHDFYFCPYHPQGTIKRYSKNSNLRKPNIGMITKASKKWNIDLNKSFMIGDQKTDRDAAKKANVNFFFKKNQSLLTIIKKICNI